MSDQQHTPGQGDPAEPIPLHPDGANGDLPPPRVYKLRLALIVAGLAALALVSTVFGMMMAVASDLPELENRREYQNARNSILYDVQGRRIGILTGRENRILVRQGDISRAMKSAIIAIEDQRFYENQGVDVRGIARALWADVSRRKAVQGASTITQQFVKNALAAQSNRTVFQKLREAALAYHLTRKWDKQKILTEYLNTVYFGNGAYGIESAARVYFGRNHGDCGDATVAAGSQPRCASELTVPEAALIAGMVASPSAYDPLAHPVAARQRRALVLDRMYEQTLITQQERDEAKNAPLPTRDTITLPRENSSYPYFTTWVKQQVIDHFGAQRALSGGLQIRTSLDLDMQKAAEQAVAAHLSNPAGPAAALVALDNKTGEVRAMVGGRVNTDYNDAPFNLATQGQRQPGSSFKAFVLAQALRSGISPNSTWTSQQKQFTVPNSGGKEKFVVRNYEGSYAGVRSLASATTASDNSVYAEVGIKVGVKKIARLARRMGIRTPVSTNYAITLGGLKHGVTPLDMAHAYDTLSQSGNRITGSFGAPEDGPVGIDEVCEGTSLRKGKHCKKNKRRASRVLPKGVVDTETSILQSVVCCGTGKSAAIDGFAAGKTGTTENYGDAWFVGWSDRFTVAVWVGYPDRLKSMEFDYNGGPVAGGTYPAEIWHDFVSTANAIQDQRDAEKEARRAAKENGGTVPPITTPTPSPSPAPAPDQQGNDQGDQNTPERRNPTPRRPATRAPANRGGGGGGAPPPRPAPTGPPPGTGGSGGGVTPPGQ
jgi:penicillin-binding protein 1A